MSDTLKVNLQLEDGLFKSTLDQDKQSVSNFQNQTKKSDDEVRKFVQSLNNAAQSTTNYKSQLRNIQKELTDLTLNYRNLSDAEKASAQGREMSDKINELTQQAATFKDTIGDVQRAIINASSDTLYWDALSLGIGVAKDGMTAFLSVTGLADTESKKFKETMAKIIQVETSLRAVQTTINALQRDSALIQGLMAAKMRITNALMKSQTVATAAQAVATGTATTAQLALNAAVKACPYVAIGSAVIGVASALWSYCSSSDDATESTNAQAEALQRAEEEFDNWKTTIKTTSGTVLTSYVKMREEWKDLKTEMEKNQFIEDNKDEFHKMGVEIDNISDCEDFLITNTGKVVEAFMQRGKAAAYAAKAAKLWEEYIDHQENQKKKMVLAGDVYYSSNGSYYRDSNGTTFNNGVATLDSDGKYHYTRQGAAEYNKALLTDDRSRELLDQIEENTKNSVEATKQSEKILYGDQSKAQPKDNKDNTTTSKRTGGTGAKKYDSKKDSGSGNGNKPNVKNEQTNYDKLIKAEEEYRKTLQKLEQKYKDGLLGKDPKEAQASYLKAQQNAAASFYDAITSIDYTKDEMNKFGDKVEELKNNAVNAWNSTGTAYDEIQKSIDDNKKQIEAEERKHKEMETALERAIIGYKKISEIGNKFKILESDDSITPQSRKEAYQKMMQQINTREQLSDAKDAKNFFDIARKYDKNNPNGNAKPFGDNYTKSSKESIIYAIEFEPPIKQIEKNLQEIEGRRDIAADLLKPYNNSLEELQKRASEPGETIAEETLNEYNKIQDEIDTLIKSTTDLNKELALTEARDNIKSLRKELALGLVDSFESVTNSVFGLVDGISSLSEKWDEMSAWEKLEGIFSNIFSGIDMVMTWIECITSIIDLVLMFTAAQDALALASDITTASEVTQMSTEMAMNTQKLAMAPAIVASNMAISASEKIATSAANTAAYASIPFAGPALAAAAQAEYIALWSVVDGLAAFADGGVFRGNGTIGDMHIARVNPGEMILNGSQLSRLFNLLNGSGVLGSNGNITTSNVEFKIKGLELVGLLKNFNTKRSKII